MSVKDEKRMAKTEMKMVRWAMGVSLSDHRRNEEILEEAKVEQIARYEKEKAGVVRPRQKKRRNRDQSSCRNEDGGEAP